MSLLWVFFEEDYQTVRLDEQFNREAVIGPEIEHTVTISSLSFDEGAIRLSPNESNDGFSIYQGEEEANYFHMSRVRLDHSHSFYWMHIMINTFIT